MKLSVPPRGKPDPPLAGTGRPASAAVASAAGVGESEGDRDPAPIGGALLDPPCRPAITRKPPHEEKYP